MANFKCQELISRALEGGSLSNLQIRGRVKIKTFSAIFDPALKWLLAAISSPLLFGIPASAAAETGSTAKQLRTIEEVVVTARRREEPLQEVPVAATVLSEAELRNHSVQDLFDIQFQVPNLQITPFPAVNADASVSIRGQSQFEPVITLDPAVGIYLDSVYLGRATGALLNLVDLNRVEVLMGPQGTLYGRNTTGGVINLISNQNSEGDFDGYLEFTGGSYSQNNYTAAISFPIFSDRLSARVSYRNANHDGYGYNSLLSEDLDDESARYWRVNLNWTPGDNVEVFLSYDDTRQRERSALFHLKYLDPAIQDPACFNEPVLALGCVVNFAITGNNWSDTLGGDPRRIQSDVSTTHDIDVSGISGTVIVDFSGISFKSITAYRELSRRNINDIDGTEWEILHPDADADQHQLSQEFQLFGESHEGRGEWIGGLFFFDEEGNDNTTVIGIPDLNPFSPSIILPHGENSSYAAFGHLVYSLTDQLDLTVGLRYTHEKRELNAQQFNAASCSLEYINEPPCRTVVSETFSDWSYTTALDYRWSNDLLTYLSVSRGFKSGGFNARATKQLEFEPFDPEIVDNFEIGLKSEWLDNRVQLNLAAFYSDYQDIQRAQLIALSPTEIATRVSNAASAYVTGGELQFTALPAPGLMVSATAGLTIAKYDEFFDTDGQGNVVDKSHLDFPRTPRWSYSAMVKYTLPYLGGISFQADYSWVDKTYNDVNNSELIAQEDLGLLNLRVSTVIPDWNLELAFFVKNVTDELYVTGGLDFTGQFGYAGTFLGPPRTYHGQVTWRFGEP